MKTLIKLVIGLVFIVIAAALVVPFLIPVETYKAEITKQVKDATGRDLVIGGDIKAQGFPSVGLRLEKVTLSNPKGYAAANMLEVASLDVQVELLPLLSRQLEVKRLVLEKPVVNLEISGKGVPNWIFTPPPSEDTLPALKSEIFSFVSDAHAAEATASPLAGLKLGQITIHNGILNFKNQPAKQEYTLEALQLETSLPNISAPLDLKSAARFNKEEVAVTATIGTLETLLNGHDSNLAFKLTSAPLALAFDGKASLQKAAGALTFSTPSIPKLAAWAGSPMNWKGSTALALSGKGSLSCTQAQCSYKQAVIDLDGLSLRGEVGAVFGAAVPFIAADLQTETLDVRPYMPAEKSAQRNNFSIISSANAAPAAGWSTEAIDLKGLRAVNADIALRAKSIITPQVSLQDVTASAKLKGGALNMSVPTMKLYGGTGKLDALVDGSAVAPAISSQITLTGVNAEALLKDFAQFERFSGTADFTTRVNAHGANQQQLVSSLAGDGKLMVRDGAIKGINIAQMVKDTKAVFTGAASTSEKTDFAELGGTYTIVQGILNNKDLAMKAPLIRLKGEGDVDLSAQFVKYRLTPEIVNTLQGQGGKDKTGLAVPIIVVGPFANLSFRPDLQAGIQDALQNPEKVKETVKNVKEQIKENKGEIKQNIQNLKDLKKNPDAINNLLKGFGR